MYRTCFYSLGYLQKKNHHKNQSRQKPDTPTKKPAHASYTASYKKGQRAKAIRNTILQPVDWKTQLQKVRQNETTEEYVSDEGTRKNFKRITN